MLHTHLSSGAGKIGQSVADVPSGLSLTPPHGKRETKNLKKFLGFGPRMTLKLGGCVSMKLPESEDDEEDYSLEVVLF
jgi:hypothetical protein